MYGNLENLDDGRWQLRFTRVLRHPREKVWQAITEPEHLLHWFPTTIEGDRAAGAVLRFSFSGGQAPPFDGEMLEYDPPSVMELQWGPDIVRVELESTEQGTQLTLLDIFDERGKAARDGAGWHTCLDGLEAHLHGDENPRDEIDKWRELQPHYVEQFGPEAATIAPPKGFE